MIRCRTIASFLLIAVNALAFEPPSPAAYGVHMENQWIPMKDGIRLSVTLYMPDGAKPEERFPAILEYTPYRKDDAMAERDYSLYAYFARRGYACARVDVRGFGSSEGVPTDREYSAQEQADGLQVINWLAHQPWSNGNVGMMGISWSGFNSLQLAMQNPPELKAIIAADATNELFHDDIHYIDGMVHIDEFELNMDMAPGITPSPDYTLDEKTLGPRFESAPWSLLYLKHQRDGQFWRSPVRPLSEIRVPSFLIAGLMDGYRDSVPAMLEQTPAPVKAIIGPWNHTFPNDADPGPQYEWRDEAVRWWDYWLKNRDTGVLQDPKILVYLRHWYPPDMNLPDVPGEWRREGTWPPREAKDTTYYLTGDHSLSLLPAQSAAHQLKYVPSIGVEAGFWWGELLPDVRPMDAFSLVYDSVPLSEDLAILGRPAVILRASATAPLANWFARLSDVAPDGSVTQITGAGLNGAQRDSMTDPSDLEPGKLYTLNLALHLTSWIFPKGHRIRIAISNAQWPMILPTPYAMSAALELGGAHGSHLTLPVVPAHAESVTPFRPSAASPDQRADMHSEGGVLPGKWTVSREINDHKTTAYWHGESKEWYPWGKETDYENLTYEADDEHPEKSAVQGEARTVYALKGRTLIWQGHLSVKTDRTNFYYTYTRELLKDGKLFRTKTWKETIPRDHQ